MKLLGLALSKKKVIVRILLILYIGFIIYTTLLCREPRDYREYNFQLFWSYQRFFDDVRPQGWQILMNILFFILFGGLVPLCVDGSEKRKLAITVISACLLSGTVEFLQLLYKLGFAEFDDVFDNTMGAAIGAVLVLIFIKFAGEVEMFKGKNGIYNRYFKRLIDIVCALLALIVFCWLYAIIAILVRIKLGSPIIFKQARPGKIDPKTGKETIFYLYKFRSMTDTKDKEGNLLSDDERLTKFGRLLRSTSMDELPEAINILKGNMSVVGPRPLLVRYLDRYNAHQARRHEVRPGFTGHAQVHGRNAISWEDKFNLDVEYVDHITFLGDWKIIFQTIKTVLKREGINSDSSVTMEEFMGTEDVHVSAVSVDEVKP